MTPLVRASGCVVYRRCDPDRLEVLVVHRPRYDDWSFPKGKLDPGETDEECARRELAEETGLVADLGVELPAAEYTDHKGRPKLVRYWAVEMPADRPDPAVGFEANDEVDRLDWMDEASASLQLSYHHDQELLRGLRSSIEP